MRSILAALLFIFTVIASVAVAFDLPFYALPPEEKFGRAWREDLDLLEKSKRYPEPWHNLAKVEFTSNETRLHEWLAKTKSPFQTKKDGQYKLQVLGVHWIEGYRYGVVLQYNWIDLKSGNTIGEFARTLKLGVIY